MKQLTRYFKGEGLRAQLLRGAGGSAVVKALNMGLVLISGVLLARMLGPEQYGIYAFVLSIVTLIGLPTKAGLPTLLVRETARNQLDQNWGLMRGLLRAANSFVISYSIAAVFVATLFVWWRWGGQERTQVNTFLWALWLLPIISFEAVRTGALRGLRWVVSSQLPEQIVRPLFMTICLVVIFLLDAEFNSIYAVKLHILSVSAAFVVGSILLFKALPNEISASTPDYSVNAWVSSLMPLTLFSGLKLMDTQVSILLLGILSTTEQVGLFKVAATGAILVAFGHTAINLALAPQIARLYRQNNIKKLQEVVRYSAVAATSISVPLAIVLILFGKDIVGWVFGADYVPATIALSIMCVGQVVNTATGAVALILNMSGNEKYTILGVALSIVANLFLSVILIPVLGISGAAIAYSVSLIIWNIVLMYMVKKIVGIKTFIVG